MTIFYPHPLCEKNLKILTNNTFLVILGVPKNIFIFQIQFGDCVM